MSRYIAKRLGLIIPTLLGIMVLNFFIIQVAPGGPVERLLLELSGGASEVQERLGGPFASNEGNAGADPSLPYRGAERLRPEFVKEIERMFGFDKPIAERFLITMGRLLVFDFGNSFFRGEPVMKLVLERLPVSISLGLWSTLLIYLIAVPLGIARAVRRGTRFDLWSGIGVLVCHAIPGFLFAILLIVFFAGGRFLNWFPLGGLVSEDWASLSLPAQVIDYFWHMALPTLALTVGGFAALAMITRNSFLEEIGKLYTTAARARGATPRRVLWGHVFRNAMLIVISGLPGALLGILLTGALFIEVIFSLDGLGLLGFEAALNRDYPVMFGTLFVFTLLGLLVNLLSDLAYVWIDPRIDFEGRR